MVGFGIGVVFFRGFVCECRKMVENGQIVGKIILFFGCCKFIEDFLYFKEWEEVKQVMGDSFEIVIVFFCESNKKVYVQYWLKERFKEINEFFEKKVYFYVCGDVVNMVCEVYNVLGQIIFEERGVLEVKVEDIVKNMRVFNQYQVCFNFLYYVY